MKKNLLMLAVLLVSSVTVHAQWNTHDLVTSTTNTVGIGTNTPSYPFHLYNTTARSTNNGSYADFGFDSFNETNWQGSHLYFARARGTVISPLGVQSGDMLGWFDFFGHDGTSQQRSGQLLFKVDNTPSTGFVPGAFMFYSMSSAGVNTERLRINSNGNSSFTGNLGINVSAPVSTFQVNSNWYKLSIGNAMGSNLNYGTSYIGFNAARIGSSSSLSNWTIEGDGFHNGGGVMYTDIFGDIYLAPIPSNGTTTRTLTDVDIKNSIVFKVAANGTTYAKAITVTTTNWPDYVFKKDYRLPSLSEVKTYIDQNQHLPEIPSAEAMQKNGINLEEMNKLLMKKMEELTLYLIEKDKQDKELKEQLNELKKQMQLLIKR